MIIRKKVEKVKAWQFESLFIFISLSGKIVSVGSAKNRFYLLPHNNLIVFEKTRMTNRIGDHPH